MGRISMRFIKAGKKIDTEIVGITAERARLYILEQGPANVKRPREYQPQGTHLICQYIKAFG